MEPATVSFVSRCILTLAVIVFYPLTLGLSYVLSRLVASPRAEDTTDEAEPISAGASEYGNIGSAKASPASYGTDGRTPADDSPAAVAVGPETTPSSSISCMTKLRRICHMIPRPPPVLLMLLTGIAIRVLLDSDLSWVRFLFGSWMPHKVDGLDDRSAAAKSAGRRQAWFLWMLLWATRPIMLMALAVIAENIGSHLCASQLKQLRRPLTLFLCCFFTIVYVGMLLVYNGVANPLFGLSQRHAALEAGVHDLVKTSLSGVEKGTGAEADVRATADALLSFHQVYLNRMAWTFALVAASVTIERSSPEFLSAMQHTGVTSGLVPVFTLCVTACQDVFALFAFILFSAMASSQQTEVTVKLSAKIDALQRAILRLTAQNGDGAGGGKGFEHGGRTREAKLANHGSTGRQIVLILNATIGAVLTALLMRRLCLFVLVDTKRMRGTRKRQFGSQGGSFSESNNNNNNNASDNNVAGEMDDEGNEPISGSPLFFSSGSPTAKPVTAAQLSHTYSPYVVLVAVALVLMVWSVLTPAELILAAVFTGAAINFYTTCPYFEAGMRATQTLCNLLLFTTMGLRTSFTSRTGAGTGGSSDTDAAADPSPLVVQWQSALRGPSAGMIILWGTLFFTVRVFYCWLGGLAGGYAAQITTLHGRERLAGEGAGEQTACLPDAAPVTTAPDASEDVNGVSMAKVVRASGVQWYIGLALLTQLAIALTLNQRGSEEYDDRLRDILPKRERVVASGAPRGFHFSLEEVTLSMNALTKSYMVAIMCAMVVGPVLGAWYLRKVSALSKRVPMPHSE